MDMFIRAYDRTGACLAERRPFGREEDFTIEDAYKMLAEKLPDASAATIVRVTIDVALPVCLRHFEIA
jgi:hypothetical protein